MISRHAPPTRHRWCARNCVNLLAVAASTPDNRSIVFVTIHNPLQPASLRGVRRRMPWRENWWYQHGSYNKALMWVWCPSSLSVSLQTEDSRCCWIYVNLKICFLRSPTSRRRSVDGDAECLHRMFSFLYSLLGPVSSSVCSDYSCYFRFHRGNFNQFFSAGGIV